MPFSNNERNNTKVDTESLGRVMLRYVSWNDNFIFHKLVYEEITDREFVLRILFKQLIEPDIPIKQLNGLPEKELQQIATAFVSNEEYTFRYIKYSDDLFADFRAAIKHDYETQLKQFGAVAKNFKKQQADALSRIMPSITDRLDQFQSLNQHAASA